MQAIQMLAPFILILVVVALIAAGVAVVAVLLLRQRSTISGSDLRAIRKQIDKQEREKRVQTTIKQVAEAGGYEVTE